VLAVFAIVEVADHSLLPTISVSPLFSSDLIYREGWQLCVDSWTNPSPFHIAFFFISIFVLVGIPLLVVLGIFRNHKKGTVRPGHTWVQTYRYGLYWFELLLYAEKLALASIAWMPGSPWTQLTVGCAISGGRLALHLVFAPLADGDGDGGKWSQPNRSVRTIYCSRAYTRSGTTHVQSDPTRSTGWSSWPSSRSWSPWRRWRCPSSPARVVPAGRLGSKWSSVCPPTCIWNARVHHDCGLGGSS
jgi:hypothetical protein